MMHGAQRGGEVAQDGCGAEGGAHGNRKHRPLSVSPRLELASLKIHFHFQNETSRAGSEPLVPGVSPALRDGMRVHNGAAKLVLSGC